MNGKAFLPQRVVRDVAQLFRLNLKTLGILFEMVVVIVYLAFNQIVFPISLEEEIRSAIIFRQFPLQIDFTITQSGEEELHEGIQKLVRRLAHGPGDIGQIILLPETGG